MRLASSHDYVLLRVQGAEPEVLADDDPLYAQFQDQVLSDPYLATLFSLIDETATAYVSSNRASPVPATAANYPLIVLDSADPGALHNLQGYDREVPFAVELALGLGNQGQVDLPWAQQHMAAALGTYLLGLAGLPPVAGQVSPEQLTTPEIAFYRGFGLALEAVHAQDPEVQALWRERAQSTEETRAQLDRVQQVMDNGYRFLYTEGRPTLQIRSRVDAQHTPGVVAAFFVRLIQRSTPYYPQRQLLWFFGYPPEQVSYAKIILALHEMPPTEHPSLQGFIDSYSKTFPADRRMIIALADEVLGQAAP